MGAAPHQRKRALLVVAADETTQQLVAATFSRADLDLLVADNANSARTLVGVTRPALVVIVGSYRPALDWVAVATTLRQEPGLEGVPIIVVGLDPEAQASRMATESGVDAYFRLPFQPFDLLMKAQELLAQRCRQS